MPSLVELAEEILRQAKALEKQLTEASAPQPTIDAGGPTFYPSPSNHPGIYEARSALIDASKTMFQLALGPADTLRGILGPGMIDTFILNLIDHHDIVNLVPKQGSIPLKDLASKMSVEVETLERFMRFAFSMNLFQEKPAGCVSHTALSEALPILSYWSRLVNREEFGRAFSSWPTALSVYSEPATKTTRQIPWNIGNKMDTSFFDHIVKTGGMRDFSEAMRSISNAAGSDKPHIISGFDWASLKKGPVVDLGGGNGSVSLLLAETFPELNFIIQDLPTNEEPANALIPSHLKDRMSFQVQDFFQPQTRDVGAKAFMMRAIMHDWPDEDCARILRNLIPEVEKGAKIIIIDRILPPPGHKPTHLESYPLFMDLLMFTLLGSKERNIEQWKSLIQKTDPKLKILSTKQAVGGGALVIGI